VIGTKKPWPVWAWLLLGVSAPDLVKEKQKHHAKTSMPFTGADVERIQKAVTLSRQT